jgi:hypothetical protein
VRQGSNPQSFGFLTGDLKDLKGLLWLDAVEHGFVVIIMIIVGRSDVLSTLLHLSEDLFQESRHTLRDDTKV